MATARPRYAEKRTNVILVQDRISKTSKRSLRPSLRCRRITPFSRNVQPIPEGSVIVNFGAGALPFPERRDLRILNSPHDVAKSANKLRTFELLKAAGVATPHWTVARSAAQVWIDKKHKVLCRLNLSSSGGRGIHIAVPMAERKGERSELRDAPLYTRYFPKTHEFRVHVVDGKAVDLTEKKLRHDLKDKRGQSSVIRSHDNGWVHAHDDLSISDNRDVATIRDLGERAIRAIGLDFGCADILACLDSNVPRRLTKSVVCEVNSAPGIENEATKNAYVKALNKLIEKKLKA